MGIQPYVDGRVVNEAHVYVLGNGLRPKRKFVIRTGNVVMISRPKTEGKMVEIAKELGAKIVTGRRIRICDAVGKFDLVVDASGYPSQWCREFGNKPKGAAAIEAFTDYELDELIFGLYPRIDGYFWVFSTRSRRVKRGGRLLQKEAARAAERTPRQIHAPDGHRGERLHRRSFRLLAQQTAGEMLQHLSHLSAMLPGSWTRSWGKG